MTSRPGPAGYLGQVSRSGSALARLRSRPLLLDGVLAVLVIGLGVLGLYTSNESVPAADSPDALAVLLVIGAGAPVAVRRRWPEVALLTALAATVAFYLLEYVSPTVGVATLLFVYTVAAHRQLKVAALFTVGTLAALYVLIAADAPHSGGFAAYLSSTLTTVVAYSIGRNVRTRRAYTAALEERAAHAEAEREALADMAVAEERRRLARELHDVVAHHVSVMGVLAAGARRSLGRADAAERADETLATIETTARTTLRELRRLLDVLREDEEEPSGIPPAPQPGLEMLPTLVQQVRDAGLPVEVTVEGSATSLPPGVDLSAYRIVQEALTNSLRHGGPARALVRLGYADNELVVQVDDDGRGQTATLGANGAAGHGLMGMRERVALYGGSLQAGPRSGGGFRVVARLPLEASGAGP